MNPKIVFVVDDEPIIADTLAVILNRSGFVAKSFHRPAEVLEAAELIVPDLLVSDVVMPGMTGVELANRIRSQYPECKCLLFSGQANTRELLRSAHDDYEFEILSKPIHPADLLAKIEQAL